MKNHRTLLIKFILGYAAAGLLAFVFAVFGAERLSSSYLLDKEADRLLDHARRLRVSYESGFADEEERLAYIASYASGMECTVWITDARGTIFADSAWNGVPHEPVPTSFSPVDFGRNSWQTGDFFGSFEKEMLSVYVPLTSQYRTVGYIIIHEPVSSLREDTDHAVSLTFMATAIAFVLTGVILFLIFLFHVTQPMKKVTTAVNEYARGNLSYKADVHSHDEFRILAEALNDMSSRLAQTGEDQRKFIANVSHDFRSPLTSIKGYLEAILDGTIPPEMQQRYLSIVLDETGRLTKLTSNMLELNNLSGGTYLTYTDFDINAQIRAAMASAEGQARSKDISFELVTSKKELFVTADQTRISQVLYNLIDNAIKFSHQGGRITVETSANHGLAFISVKDEGIGISSADQTRIFERFYKTDASRGKDKKGTGLGLSIVKEAVEAHGSTIDVISTEGVGTEFIFRLKLAERELEGFL